MERFIEAIERSVTGTNWYAALSLALTMPDICGWLEDPKKRSEARYKDWFDRYLLAKYKNQFFGRSFAFITAGDCYALRCAYLHEGSDEIARQRAREALTKFIFATTGSHLIRVDNLLMVDVASFCGDVCDATRSWLQDTSANTDVVERMNELLVIRSAGFHLAAGIFVQ